MLLLLYRAAELCGFQPLCVLPHYAERVKKTVNLDLNFTAVKNVFFCVATVRTKQYAKLQLSVCGTAFHFLGQLTFPSPAITVCVGQQTALKIAF